MRTIERFVVIAQLFFLASSAMAQARDAKNPPPAKALIQIWMWGGPSQLDTFDPKPEAGSAFTGPYTGDIPTNVDGIRVAKGLPLLARIADKYAIVRSMTHGVNAHETASYLMQTGHGPGAGLVYPSLGAVVSFFKGRAAGYSGILPPYIVLTESQGRFSEEGFLGPLYKPFVTGGDPAANPFAVEGIVAPGLDDKRQTERRESERQRADTEHRGVREDPAERYLVDVEAAQVQKALRRLRAAPTRPPRWIFLCAK